MDLNKKLKKRGISPVVATVLLVGMVIVIGIIIFLWFRSFTQESAVKFNKNIQLVCGEVIFAADWIGGIVYISNDGNVPIFNFKVKEDKGDGNFNTEEINKDITVADDKFQGLNSGGSWNGDYDLDLAVEKIVLIPVLLGESEDKGEVAFLCDEQYGVEVIVS